ncbi:MAG: methyltransferase domain-containing protein [Opitutaceae bacterium]|nr:methyltransferase domain-containing protein [Cytophagales bacterium]
MAGPRKEWFEEWFESPYYDLLYAKRNEEEAGLFLDNLLIYLNLSKEAKILDLACGKGRHSIYLNKKGYNVTGLDLSERSIAYAKTFQNNSLRFLEQDMRVPLNSKYNLIVNLFTSFGYFDVEDENVKVLESVKYMLKQDGIFIIDYLNGQKIPTDLNYSDTKEFSGGYFKIRKTVANGYIIKKIEIIKGTETLNFSEKVRLYNCTDFENMFKQVGLQILNTFGDYNLNKFDPINSERMIYITKMIKE